MIEANHIPDLGTLVERAEILLPGMRERSQETEDLRTLPETTKRELIDGGFYRIFQPKRYGGYELDFVALVRLSAIFGRACGSTAWVFANLAEHNRLNGMRNPKAQEELWGADEDATVSASFPAEGATFKPVDGGVLLDGEWGFASGIDAATWNDFTVFLPREGDAPPEHHFAMVPVSEGDRRLVCDRPFWHRQQVASGQGVVRPESSPSQFGKMPG